LYAWRGYTFLKTGNEPHAISGIGYDMYQKEKPQVEFVAIITSFGPRWIEKVQKAVLP
jgi:coproporphyrinogen III oxidase